MSADEFVKKNIFNYLVNDGCDELAAKKAADEGVKFFNRGNHKDPYFESLCFAATAFAETLDKKYKFKKPKPSTGKPFINQKPRTRKHKTQQSLI